MLTLWFLFILQTAHAQDLAYLPILQEEVQKQNLAQTPQWLALGHYRSSLWGGYKSEIDAPDYFLSPLGKTNPEAELLSTLQAFFDTSVPKNAEPAQCRYISRRNWLFKALNIDTTRLPRMSCERLENWKNKLDAVDVSLIFASSYLNNAASMFGHTFLKFHSRGNTADRDLLNYGVGFAANTGTDSGLYYVFGGLSGGYRGYFSLRPFHETLREYSNLEGRDIWEYRLQLSQEEIDTIVYHLLEIEQAYFDYFFLDENCSYQLLALLDVARPSLRLSEKFTYQVIPADTIRHVTRQENLVKNILYRPALETIFKTEAAHLNWAESSLSYRLVHRSSQLDLQHLPIERQVAVLDSSLGYAAVLGAKKPQEWRETNHQLKIRRAALGVSSPPNPDISQNATRPEQGHDSARLAAASGQAHQRTFVELRLRPAYQDLLSSDVGYLPGTQLQVLNAAARIYPSTRHDSTRFRLEDLTVLEFFSSTPWNLYFQPLSWRAHTGYRRLKDQSLWSDNAATLNGGVGVTWDPWPKHLRMMAFATATTDVSRSLAKGYRVGGSPELYALFQPLPHLRVLAQFEFHSYLVGDRRDFTHLQLGTSWDFARNWELRATWAETAKQPEWQGQFLWYFML